MSRLLFPFYLIASVLLVSAAPARACKQLSYELLFAKASAVFVARLVRAEEAWGSSPMSDAPEALVEGTFRIVEVLKGQPPKDGRIRGLPRPICTVWLVPATDYLFFLHDDTNFVLPNGGTTPIRRDDHESFIDETKRLLERVRALADKAKSQ